MASFIKKELKNAIHEGFEEQRKFKREVREKGEEFLKDQEN